MKRVGHGFDVHAFDATRPLVLGGVTIPDHPGLAGHSDADVLTHAVGDALLGAAGLGDLGAWFPGTEEWKDVSSLRILSDVVASVRAEGWSVVNVDATVVAERPRLTPFRDPMIEHLSRTLGVDRGMVSVKATSSDGLGFTGRGEGIAAFAVAMVTSAD
ncbi:MAG: 2-C-methyl-D-erythritol 2,4-cyclodiphosphate synthase [Actinomycetota bacterium]